MKQRTLYTGLGLSFILLSLLIFIFSPWMIEQKSAEQLSLLSNFGGWAGGLTAPFLNVAGFFMIYAAFRQQGKETQHTRMEFDIQRFELTFFNLLNLYHQNLHVIEQRYKQEASGDTHFFAAAMRFLARNTEESASPQRKAEVYLTFYQEHYNYIDHFVRHLLFTVQFVVKAQSFEGHRDLNSHVERQKYIDILNAQLSADQLTLLWYQIHLDPQGYAQGFRDELKVYGFFKRLSPDEAVAL